MQIMPPYENLYVKLTNRYVFTHPAAVAGKCEHLLVIRRHPSHFKLADFVSLPRLVVCALGKWKTVIQFAHILRLDDFVDSFPTPKRGRVGTVKEEHREQQKRGG